MTARGDWNWQPQKGPISGHFFHFDRQRIEYGNQFGTTIFNHRNWQDMSNEIVEHFVLWTWQNVQRNNKIVGHFVRCYDIIMESESGQLWHGIIGNR